MSERGPRDTRQGKPQPASHREAAGAGFPWSMPVQVADIPETGRRIELAADAAAREQVAKMAGVLGLPRLEAVFDLVPLANGGVHVTGAVSAGVGQICVVTLDPITSQIEEQVDLVFTPPDASTPLPELTTCEAHDHDPPETLHNGMIDLGAIATEFLMLGIDPYPRKPDAKFEAPGADDAKAHPFAALAALKDSGAKRR